MAIPKNILKEHLLKAIEKIDKEGVPNDASSRYYDVIYNNKKYPPKLIVSYANYFANGQILSRNDFSGGEGTDCFRLLELNQFLIAKKEGYISNINIWIEKTIVKGREDRNFGVRAFGKVLWSPQKDKRGADIYKNMRAVSVGDIVLHLIDNSAFVGISRVKTKAIETVGLEGTEWEGPAYLIELEDYQVLEPYVTRDQLFEEKNKKNLTEILEESEVFFNRNFTLRQGAYLTPCSVKMLALINSIFFDNSKTNLPYIESIDMTDNQLHKPDFFDFNRLNNDIYESGLVYSKTLLSRFTASLITKPFLILTGLSGSGKTKLAQAFVQWISESEKQYKIIPVGADWTNREPLLGYPNGLESKSYVTPDSGALQLIIEASKGENKNKPFFMILDEMNLSHVERYFADFLSIMESKEKLKLYSGEKRYSKFEEGQKPDEENFIPNELEWPKNLFIIGTVNIDETTYMFSPKVLDRANVIEFRITADEMKNFFKVRKGLKMEKLFLDEKDKSKGGAGQSMGESFFQLAGNKTTPNLSELNGYENTLNKFFNELQVVGSEFGYRSATEIEMLITKLGINGFVDEKGNPHSNETKIDIAIMQKLLPKLHGSRKKLVGPLETLAGFCISRVNNSEPEEQNKNKNIYQQYISEKREATNWIINYPISFEKIERMLKNVIENGFTSYAEA